MGNPQDQKQQKRRDTRHAHLSELSVIYEGHEEDINVRPPDISPHGMFINTSREYPHGAVLILRFRLSRTGVEIKTRCEVRYCLKGVGIGVEFLDVPPETAHAIESEISAFSLPA